MKLAADPKTNTLPKLLRRNAERYPRQTGMREKDRGIWQSYNWRTCEAHVRDTALWRRRDLLAAISFRFSATTGHASTGRNWPRRRSAACRYRSIKTRLPASSRLC
jgi:hypothetical protein